MQNTDKYKGIKIIPIDIIPIREKEKREVKEYAENCRTA